MRASSDGTGAAATPGITIVIENGWRIRQMGPSGAIATRPPRQGSRLDRQIRGAGIINAHGHVGANGDPQLP